MITARGKHRRMDKAPEEDVRAWRSRSGNPQHAPMAWRWTSLMAEQMVLEMMAASARIQDAAFVLRRLQSQEKNFRARFPWEKFARLRSGVESAVASSEWLRIIGFRRSDTC